MMTREQWDAKVARAIEREKAKFYVELARGIEERRQLVAAAIEQARDGGCDDYEA